jgi:hypothetical protein
MHFCSLNRAQLCMRGSDCKEKLNFQSSHCAFGSLFVVSAAWFQTNFFCHNCLKNNSEEAIFVIILFLNFFLSDIDLRFPPTPELLCGRGFVSKCGV